MKDLSMTKVLATQMPEGGTVREYLRDLLQGVWELEESFSGKYGLYGNSGWKNEVLRAVAGKEELTDVEAEYYNKLVLAAIRYMCI